MVSLKKSWVKDTFLLIIMINRKEPRKQELLEGKSGVFYWLWPSVSESIFRNAIKQAINVPHGFLLFQTWENIPVSSSFLAVSVTEVLILISALESLQSSFRSNIYMFPSFCLFLSSQCLSLYFASCLTSCRLWVPRSCLTSCRLWIATQLHNKLSSMNTTTAA